METSRRPQGASIGTEHGFPARGATILLLVTLGILVPGGCGGGGGGEDGGILTGGAYAARVLVGTCFDQSTGCDIQQDGTHVAVILHMPDTDDCVPYDADVVFTQDGATGDFLTQSDTPIRICALNGTLYLYEGAEITGDAGSWTVTGAGYWEPDTGLGCNGTFTIQGTPR